MGVGLFALMLTATMISTRPAPDRSTPAARQMIANASGQLLQGNGPAALAILGRQPDTAFSAKDLSWRRCVADRLRGSTNVGGDAALPRLPLGILENYRRYWRASLSDPTRRDAEEDLLRRRLARLLDLPRATPMSEIEEQIAARLRPLNLYVLTGRTAPLLEFMLWRSETRDMREVALPEGSHRVPLVILDDFVSLGWSAWATCERSLSGGWVRPDGIYAVHPGWPNFAGEAFLVNFLAHEAQHFADQARFGKLESWELEYRAKLAELALANTRLATLIAAFSANQGGDKSVPHSYANRLVLAALRERLGLAPAASLEKTDAARIRVVARDALFADTARRTGRQQTQ